MYNPRSYSSAHSIEMKKIYLYETYKYLRKENSPYGVSVPNEIVFNQLSYDELCYLLSHEGNYLILFGGPWCANTAGIIDYINYYARKYDVNEIYMFDFRADGQDIRTSICEDITAQPAYDGPEQAELKLEGAEFNYMYGELVRSFLTNLGDWQDYHDTGMVRYLDDYDNIHAVTRISVPFLFLYNKDNTVDHSRKGRATVNGRFPIVYAFDKSGVRDETDGQLYSDIERHDESTMIHEFGEQLEASIFRPIAEQKLDMSFYTQADYIREAYQMNGRGHSYKTQDAFTTTEQINLQMLTLGELMWLLNQKGTFVILFGGAWCANTQAGVATINDYAVANDVNVYMFDMRIDGKYPIDFREYSRKLGFQIRSQYNSLRRYYVDMLEQHFKNIVAVAESKWEPHIIEYTDAAGNLHSVGRMQVPYIMAYDRDAVDDVGKPAQILAYNEEMFELIDCSEKYIYATENYNSYRSGISNVFAAYCKQVGLELKEISIDRTAPKREGEPTVQHEHEDHRRDHDWFAETLPDKPDDNC